jgi:hypothetical protein
MQQIQIRGICSAIMQIRKEASSENTGKKAKDAKIRFPPRINSRDMKNQVDDTKLAKYVKANGNPDHSGP